MRLSYSRDPFTCFTISMDLATLWSCHRLAFAHFGGVPGTIVSDRTKTVVRKHVVTGVAVPLHPEAAAFAEHYGFTIDVLAGPIAYIYPAPRDHQKGAPEPEQDGSPRP